MSERRSYRRNFKLKGLSWLPLRKDRRNKSQRRVQAQGEILKGLVVEGERMFRMSAGIPQLAQDVELLRFRLTFKCHSPFLYLCAENTRRLAQDARRSHRQERSLLAVDCLKAGRHTRPTATSSKRLEAIARRQARRGLWSDAQQLEASDFLGLPLVEIQA